MSFFKAYDMRGTFGVDFDLETVYKVEKGSSSSSRRTYKLTRRGEEAAQW